MTYFCSLKLQYYIVYACCIYCVLPAPVPEKLPEYHDTNTHDQSTESLVDIETAKQYLVHYGYIDRANEVVASQPQVQDDLSLSDKSLRDALTRFQAMADIPQTGELDTTTRTMMAAPRCGFPDNDQAAGARLHNKRRRRFLLSGSKWPVKSLTYNVASFPRADLNLSDAEVISTVQRALKYWSDASSLSFVEATSSSADIQMNFFVGDHGDLSPFEGPGHVLAHAYYPIHGGDLHWDGDEPWTVNSIKGRNLLYVTTHELGHALGLAHSSKHSSVMAPFYKKYNPNLVLSQDDIDGIQSIYGPPTSKETESSNEFIVSAMDEETLEQLNTATFDETSVFSTTSSTASSTASSATQTLTSSTLSTTASTTFSAISSIASSTSTTPLET